MLVNFENLCSVGYFINLKCLSRFIIYNKKIFVLLKEHPDLSILPVMVNVLASVIHAERLIDSGTLIHKLYGASSVCRYVTDGQQPVKT